MITTFLVKSVILTSVDIKQFIKSFILKITEITLL